jgi:uncharacterized protein (DUF924 family)
VIDSPDNTAPESRIAPEDVLAFWFSEDAKAHWFKSSDAFDAACRARFGAALEAAQAGELDGWGETPEGALALVILLDQLPRNIHRGTPEAFASDAKALALASDAITSGFDAAIPSEMRNFLYLPFMHSERLEDQERGLELFATNDVNDGLRFMKLHHAIIARFGRFPHRNAILGRTSTPEELDFLQQPGSHF